MIEDDNPLFIGFSKLQREIAERLLLSAYRIRAECGISHEKYEKMKAFREEHGRWPLRRELEDK